MRKDTQQLLGRRFADLRKRAKLTQGEVARRLNVAVATVSRLERGAQWTDFPTLLGLCELYGVEWTELMSIPSGSNPARGNAVQRIVDLLVDFSPAEVELVRELVNAVARSRPKTARRKGGGLGS